MPSPYTGLRFIPLRTPGGESASHIGLFVRIKIDKLSHKAASSSGKCLLKDHGVQMRKFFSSPMLLVTLKPSLDEVAEEMDVVKENEQSNEDKTGSTNTAIAGNSTDLPYNRPILVHQEADVKCIVVDIHAHKPHTDDS